MIALVGFSMLQNKCSTSLLIVKLKLAHPEQSGSGCGKLTLNLFEVVNVTNFSLL